MKNHAAPHRTARVNHGGSTNAACKDPTNLLNLTATGKERDDSQGKLRKEPAQIIVIVPSGSPASHANRETDAGASDQRVRYKQTTTPARVRPCPPLPLYTREREIERHTHALLRFLSGNGEKKVTRDGTWPATTSTYHQLDETSASYTKIMLNAFLPTHDKGQQWDGEEELAAGRPVAGDGGGCFACYSSGTL
jgi:hypothetical protein